MQDLNHRKIRGRRVDRIVYETSRPAKVNRIALRLPRGPQAFVLLVPSYLAAANVQQYPKTWSSKAKLAWCAKPICG
ncbi:hypothetical protein PLICRDRAFT_417210 [Plicaturopsis crispa FD-325 SS-3]|nr:hypothetical protein PLICRDRAFT_417210 [Plicaturopsis crispa FD-325 SS-3]